MEKALEILKDVLINMDFLDDDGYHFGKYATMEAIAELEEAMKPKTCSSCYWWNDFYTQCNDHDNALAGVGDYGCNRHEPKEQLC